MRFVGVICAVLLFLPFHLHGKTKRDTIYTTDGDRIILTYEITGTANQTTVRFTEARKTLGKFNAKYKKDLPKVAVMFFDRTGNYGSEVSITNMIPEPFMTPSGVKYQKSHEGFYLVQAEPELTFTVKSNTEISIPIYLAYKPKKSKYILFSKSTGLKIPLGKQKSSPVNKATTQTVQQTITSTLEVEADNTAAIKVLESVKIAKDLISETTVLPFSDNLLDELNYLRQKRREITDDALVAEISDVMDRYEAKKQLLEEQSSSEQQALRQEAEQKARDEAQALQNKNDSIAAAQKMEAEKEKKRNLWMILGGIVLSILAFVGNQFFQSVRNKNNQLRMMDMQQHIADKAEAEAKRRARNAIRSQRNKVVNETRRKVENGLRRATTANVNGKSKRTSI